MAQVFSQKVKGIKAEVKDALSSSKREFLDLRSEIKDELSGLVKKTTNFVKGPQLNEEDFPSFVNVETGAELLLHFLILKSGIYEATTSCVDKANKTDILLQRVAKRTAAWKYFLGECEIEFKCLPSLVKSLAAANEKVEAIGKLIGHALLTKCLNICAIVEVISRLVIEN